MDIKHGTIETVFSADFRIILLVWMLLRQLNLLGNLSDRVLLSLVCMKVRISRIYRYNAK